MLQERLSRRQTVFVAALAYFISRMLNTSSASSDTAQTGFSMNFSTCFRQTALLLLTSLLSTGNSFELGSLLRKSRRSLLNVMRIFGLILLLAWPPTRLNSLVFSMRFRRINTQPSGLMGNLGKEPELS